MEEGTTREQIINQIYTIKGKEKTEEIIREIENQQKHEDYIKWWKGEQEEKTIQEKSQNKQHRSSTWNG